MRLTILAVGQMRGSPEAALFDTYAERIPAAGRRLGLSGPELIEIKEHGDAQAKLTAALAARKNPFIIALDEGGVDCSSRQLAQKIAHWRDDGHSELVFLLGPADGLGDPLKKTAHMSLSLGKMTWPHLLARAMLAEQLWRAVSILSGHPYHRD